jgi:hypothetical protein
MVNTCVVYGCTNRSTDGHSELKFFDIPKIVKHQGNRTEELTTERRRLWLARINNVTYLRVNVLILIGSQILRGKYVNKNV